MFSIISRKVLCALAMLGLASVASATPLITVEYDPTVAFSSADKAAIQSALDFYTSNMSSNFSLTVAFGAQTGGGASSQWYAVSGSYAGYYNALVTNSSGNATDTSAIASLGGPSANNPVTGSQDIVLPVTLASDLGLVAQYSTSFSSCDSLTANACITLNTTLLNTSGSPPSGLEGIVQHEIDEVLGTASALPNGGGTVPANPMAADLYRYSAPGTRSFALNTSTSVPCTGSPTAYFSVNGGVSSPAGATYNNCNNGGDYGDWIDTNGQYVQDAYGSYSQTVTLNLNSPEVTVLDAVGYNFQPSPVPEPSTSIFLLTGLGVTFLWRVRWRG